MKVLLIPDWQGCTIITDNGYCTIQGLPNDIVDKVFVSEIPISNGIGLITPLVNELTRLCTNGAKNACSFLYGAAARAAAAMGYKRIITYTLESENGASLRASGWICQGKAGGLRWTGKRQPKEDQYPAQMKLRYEKQLRKEETVNGICSGPEGS